MIDSKIKKMYEEIANNYYGFDDKAEELKERAARAKLNRVIQINSKEDIKPEICEFRNFIIGSFKVVKNPTVILYIEKIERNSKIDMVVKNQESIIPKEILTRILNNRYTNEDFMNYLMFIYKYELNKLLY